MTELVFLSDSSHVRVILGWPRRRLADSRFVAGSIAVADQLEEHGLPVIDELSLLTPDEIARNLVRASELAATWWRDSWGESDHLGLSMATMAKQDWALPCELILNAALVYGRLLRQGEYRSISGFFESPVAMCRTGPAPAFQPARSITNAVMRWQAQKCGIPVTGLTTRRPRSAEGRQWRPRLNTVDLAPAEERTSWSNRQAERGKVVLLWKNGLWKQEISAIQALAASEGWRLVTLSARELSAITPPHDEKRRSAFAEQLGRARAVMLSESGEYTGSFPQLYGNAHLTFQFDRIFAEMRTAAFLGSRFSVVIDALAPQLLILGHDAFTIERTLVGVARLSETPAVALLHGGLQPLFGRLGIAGDAQKILVWGPEDVRALPEVGIVADRILEVGSVRFEQAYRKAIKERNAVAASESPTQLAHARTDGTRHPLSVLFLTAPPNVDLSQASASPTLHRETWNTVIPLVRRRREWNFVIRPHPAYDFVEFYRSLCRRAGSNMTIDQGGSLESLLQTCDVAVLVNYCTTSAVEAALAGVPVVFLRSAMYQTPMHDDPLRLHGAINIRTLEELEEVIFRISRDSQYRSETLTDAQLMLGLVLGESGESAMHRLRLALSDLLAAGTKRAATSPHVVRPSEDVREIMERMNGRFQTAPTDADLQALLGSGPDARRGLGLALSLAASSPKELRGWSTALRHAAAGYNASTVHAVRALLMQCYLLCVMRAVDYRQWSDARVLARHALVDLPMESLRSTSFLKECCKTVVGGTLIGHSIVNTFDWLKCVLSKLKSTRYLEGSQLFDSPDVP